MDNEIKGEGNSLNYTFRMHNPRVGRFLSLDPLAPKYAHNSPYAFSENRVMDGFELEGLEWGVYTYKTWNDSKGKTHITIHTEAYSNTIFERIGEPQYWLRPESSKAGQYANQGICFNSWDELKKAASQFGSGTADFDDNYEAFDEARWENFKVIAILDLHDSAVGEMNSYVLSKINKTNIPIKVPVTESAPKISTISTKIDIGKQNKHIKGNNNYKTQVANGKSPSILEADSQNLLINYHNGKVNSSTIINDQKTRVDFGVKIGKYYNTKTGKYEETTNGIIHNSKSGAHIVPSAPNTSN